MEKTIGVVIWVDPEGVEAIAWCEDSKELALITKDTAQPERPEPGDMLRIRYRRIGGLRICSDFTVIDRLQGLGLIEKLRKRLSGAADDRSNRSQYEARVRAAI